MNCLCCGKLLPSNNTSDWHKACVKRFFGTTEIPEIDINEKTLEFLATESTNKGYSVPGVQKKLSLHLYPDEGKYRLTIVDYPTGYILKPQVNEFESLPESEQLVMRMAAASGITTVPNALVRNGDSLAYITKRIDRVFTQQKTKMLAMEDFCQLDLRSTQ
ncbi:MAG: HipA domain-containing protein, partial [Eubacteriales bacterium]